ncbi:MAG: hypothetical protein ABSG79_10970 [Bryobacteraceae bacterium]|jgi:hypothetical protein
MDEELKPWLKYSALTEERLSILANVIRNTRDQTIPLHDAAAGDNEWSLGCRIYARTCHALRSAAETYEWLTILPEKEALRFTFAVGMVPLKFYRGDVGDPPEHCCIVSEAEAYSRQLLLDLEGIEIEDRLLRLVVETGIGGFALNVTLVEMEKTGSPTGKYTIPFNMEAGQAIPLQPKPVDLPPMQLEPQEVAKEVKLDQEKKA